MHEPNTPNAHSIRPGTAEDAEAVGKVWREATLWLDSIGQPMWRLEQFSDEWVSGIAASGTLVVGLSHHRVVAVMQLIDVDPEIWPEAKAGEALYVHKLAIARPVAGKGWPHALLDWAADAARARNIPALRIDCAPRPHLVGLYQANGFAPVDAQTVHVGGFELTRLERRLA